ncbi:hypothetical protein E2C01_066460 [Portunus trituberculatus]|uniref:Uncharacterized protein n=1 Tax=Portunus trituberculatus TaxID=210409 RepID=A0A5B7HQJ7_PORTR|nr:hypothetical protein [Portunus trituberculatus]
MPSLGEAAAPEMRSRKVTERKKLKSRIYCTILWRGKASTYKSSSMWMYRRLLWAFLRN